MTTIARRLLLLASAAAWVTPIPVLAQTKEPIKIGVVSEFAAVVGQPIAQGAQLAADEINAHGGINGRQVQIIAYDDHSSAADGVRAFQRLAEQDHVAAVITTFISEVALAIEPWAARLHMPTLTPAAASDLISKQVHDKYDQYKYMFEGWFPSPILAQAVCDSSRDTAGEPVAHENRGHRQRGRRLDQAAGRRLPEMPAEGRPEGAWTMVNFNPDTTDFTPIFNEVEGKKPDVMIMGIAHVGVQPTVQWHAQQVPIPHGGHQRAGQQRHILEKHERRDRGRHHPDRVGAGHCAQPCRPWPCRRRMRTGTTTSRPSPVSRPMTG